MSTEGEAVRAIEVRIRAVGPGAVGIDGHVAVGRAGGLAVGQRVAVEVGAGERVRLIRVLVACAQSDRQTGAPFVPVTVIAIVAVFESRVPSVARNVKPSEPKKSGSGV